MPPDAPRTGFAVLCIHAEPDDVERLHRALIEAVGHGVALDTSIDIADAIDRLRQRHYNLVFVDCRLTTSSVADGLAEIREVEAEAPVLAFIANASEQAAGEATRAGVDACLTMRDLDAGRLPLCIHGAHAIAHQRVEIDALRERVERLESFSQTLAETNAAIAFDARVDPLTELFNRRAWEEAATLENARALKRGSPYGMLMIDVDHFKLLNDTAGHQSGDTCLRRLAECIRQTCRGVDVIGRYGGEEFVVLLPGTDRADAEALAERLMDAIHARALPHPGRPTPGDVTVSIGVAEGPSSDGWASIVAAADECLYRAKAAGRDRVCVEIREAA